MPKSPAAADAAPAADQTPDQNGAQNGAGDKTDGGLTAAKIAKLIGGGITVLRYDEKARKNEAITRNLAAGDVLSWRVDGKTVIAVTADGRRREAEIR